MIGFCEPVAERVRADRVGHVQVVALRHVEDPADPPVVRPQVGQLVLADPDRVAQVDLAQRPLVLPLDQLADDRVEHRDRLQRGRRGAVGRMLVGLRRDVRVRLEPFGEVVGHAAPQRSAARSALRAIIAGHGSGRGDAWISAARCTTPNRCWYDTGRWVAWVDGLDAVVSVDGDWPRVGATVSWQSGPAGRGRVTERVVGYEPLGGPDARGGGRRDSPGASRSPSRPTSTRSRSRCDSSTASPSARSSPRSSTCCSSGNAVRAVAASDAGAVRRSSSRRSSGPRCAREARSCGCVPSTRPTLNRPVPDGRAGATSCRYGCSWRTA